MIRSSSSRPESKAFQPPEPLAYISHYADPRPKGILYNSSMAGSVSLHALVLTLLILNPHWLFVKRDWSGSGSLQAGAEDKKYELINYVPISKAPMYEPSRRPQGKLYSTHDNLAISRPPKLVRGGNQMPYSKGTTQEPMITDVVQQLENTRPADGREKTAQSASIEPIPVSGTAGTPPVIEAPTADRPPSATAMIIPPNPKDAPDKPSDLAARAGPKSPDPKTGPSTKPDVPADQSIPEEVARQLKLADLGQKIFDNEASALRSEGSGFFDTKGFELSGYSQFVVERIKERWLIPSSAREDSGRAIIIFYIEKDGQISRLKLVTPSGHRLLDQAALNSILVSSPFPPLPRDFLGEHIGAKLVFSYNEVRTP